MTQWREVAVAVAPPSRSGSRLVGLVAPVVVVTLISVMLAVKGEWWRVLLAVGLLAAVVQVWAVAPTVERRVIGALARAGRAVGAAVGAVCLAATFTVVSVCSAPGRLLRGSSALGGWGALGEPGASDSAWQGAEPEAEQHRRATAAAGPRSRLARVLGVVAAVVIVDCLVGAVLTGTGALPPEDRGDIRTASLETMAQTMSSPPVGDEPWAEAYARDMVGFELDSQGLVPFLVTGFQPYESTYINVTDEERVSYRPTVPSGSEPLQVAFFGGSVMFGVGQRDEHTIPSEFARIAESSGVPVEVHNYGRPAWVSWQEQLYLEQLLARGHRYDLVVFLDGFNEVEVQRAMYSRDPTHIGANWIGAMIDDFRSKRQAEPGYVDGLGELADSYHRNSAVWRLVDALTGQREVLSGATHDSQGTAAEQVDAALGIYQRSVDQINGLTRRFDTPARYFWQPRARGWDAATLDRLPVGTTSLASVFDGRQEDLYIDEVHTNETGARILAGALWEEVESELRAASG